MARRLKKPYRMILKTITVIVVFVVLKWLWVTISTMGHGTFEGEKTEILRRRNYLTNKLLVSPEEVLNEMPGGIGSQFQGEWAMYSCSMLSAALTNISILYPDEREKSVEQIASAKIPLSRMISPALYWVMTGDDFSLDINNPKEPKVLVVGNNPDRQNIYSAALGLYNSRIVKLINKKKQLKSSVIIDELPTIYFRGLDNLIATARSNKVAVCLGFQDFSQLTRDYGDKESKVIQNTVGNVFSGQVVGETAKTLSERFGKVLQQRQSMTINRNDKSTSISTQMDSLIPASKISNLTQGIFVGAVSDNFDERIDQKIFHAEIVVDSVKVSAEMKAYQPIPVIVEFKNEDGSDNLKETIEANYRKVKQEILTLVDSEIQRIKNTPALSHLIPDK